MLCSSQMRGKVTFDGGLALHDVHVASDGTRKLLFHLQVRKLCQSLEDTIIHVRVHQILYSQPVCLVLLYADIAPSSAQTTECYTLPDSGHALDASMCINMVPHFCPGEVGYLKPCLSFSNFHYSVCAKHMRMSQYQSSSLCRTQK